MSRSSLVLAVLLGASGVAVAQSSHPADADVLATLGLGAARVQTLALPARVDAPVSVVVELDGVVETLRLRGHRMRADDFTLLVVGADGVPRAAAPRPAATVRGTIDGIPGSLVAGSVVDGALTAIVTRGAGLPALAIEPTGAHGGAGLEHAVYTASDVVDLGARCGLLEWAAPRAQRGAAAPDAGEGQPSPTSPAALGVPVQLVELACDSDVEFFASEGSSVAATELEIETIVNAVGAIYLATDAVDFTIATIVVRTTEPDPYTTTSAATLLGQFEAEWNANFTGVPRHLAHLFTGKEITGSVIGIPRLDGDFCADPAGVTDAYALSQTTFSGNFNSKVGLVAHEIGHNFGSPHCDATPDCKIMCSAIAACGAITSFGDLATLAINTKKNTTACFDVQLPPVLDAASLDEVPSFAPPVVTLTGANMGGATALLLDDGVTQSVDFTVQSVEQLTFTPPAPNALGPFSLTLENGNGASESISIAYVGNDPPVISAPSLFATQNDFDWSWGGQPGDVAYLLASTGPATMPFKGAQILVGSVVGHVEPLDDVGLGGITVNLPASAAGVTFYSQIATADGATLVFVGASAVVSSWAVF